MVNCSRRCVFVLLLLVAALPVAAVPTHAQPTGLADMAVSATTNRLYVTGGDSVFVIDGASNSVLATLAISGAGALDTNPVTNRIYVAQSGTDGGSSVAVIDGATNAVIVTIPLVAGPLGGARSVAVNPTTNRIYVEHVGSTGGGFISVIDGATNTIVATFPAVGVPRGAITVNPATNRIYVAGGSLTSGEVIVFDGATNSQIATIPLANVPNPPPVIAAVNQVTNRIYARDKVIDGGTNTVIASTSIDALAVNPTTNRIYGPTDENSKSVSVVDGASNTVLATIPLSSTPSRVVVNPSTNRVYAFGFGDTAITVIDGGNNTVVGTISPAPPSPPSPPPPPVSQGSTWFFAEGSTQPPFDTWFLIENPTSQPANVNVTFFLQPAGTVSQRFVVGPTSRFSLFGNESLPNQAFSTRIDADQQIYAERAMYVSYDGDDVTGIPGTNKTWLFAEGATVQPFHTWLLLQNPNTVPAPTTITYLLENGQTVTQLLTLPPSSRTSIFVNDVLPNAAFSSRVESQQPIIAERAMYRFPGNAATVNSGVNAPAPAWFFSEGRTSFRNLNADTFLLLENTNTTQAVATVTLYGTDGRTVTFPVGLLPTSRMTIDLDPLFSGSFGIKVTADKPIIAERSVFFGNEPLGAYSTQGATALSTSWHLAEGETRDPFDELITILNPQGQTMGVHIDFELESGQVIGRDFTVGANSKLEVLVDDILSGANSANVTTSLPSVVERTMFIFKDAGIFGRIGATDTIGFSGS